jgi:predicted MPP superfamily phosphohydrolase
VLNYWRKQDDAFKITQYSIATEKPISDFRIVMVSDLHLHEYGEGNKELLGAIEAQNPDIIAVVGDSTIYPSDDHQSAIDFLNNAAKIAPTYFSLGNHEWGAIHNDDEYDLLHALENCDAVFLNNELQEITINNNTLIICGVYDESKAKWGHTDEVFPILNGEENNNKFKLLLSHYPTMIKYSNVTPKADLVLSGHEHGGQVVAPIINKGLFSRNQGWFPEYTMGMHTIANNLVIISTGLSNSYYWFPRINNQPELVVIDVN